MANGLYTGTALSGALKVDDSGQDALLGVAKAQAGQRAQEQAAKAKAKQATEKEVFKNMSMTPTLSTPYYQRMFAKKMNEEIAALVESQRTGEGNLQVLGNQAAQRMKNYSGSIHAADKGLQKTLGEVAKDQFSYAYNDKQTIGGKEYNNFYDAMNDPYADTPEGLAEIKAKYGGSEYVFSENDPQSTALGMPENLIGYNPRKMSNPYDVAQGLVKNEMFTDFVDGKKITRGNRSWVAEGLEMNPESLEDIATQTLESQEVLRFYEEEIYKEQKEINPELTRLEFSKSGWMDDVPARIEKDVVEPLRNEMRNQKRVETTPRVVKTVKPTGVDALFTISDTPQVTHGHRGTSTGGVSYEYLPVGSKSKVTKPTTLPTGTIKVNSEGHTITDVADENYTKEGGTKKVTQAEVAPWKMTYSDKKLWFDYSAEDGTYYAVPLTAGSYRDWANRTKEDPNEVLEKAKSLTKNDNSVMNLVRGYHKELYGHSGGKTPSFK